MRAKKPIRVFYSTLTNRFYATRSWKEMGPGQVRVTGEKFDVTNDIASAIVENEVTFTPAGESK